MFNKIELYISKIMKFSQGFKRQCMVYFYKYFKTVFEKSFYQNASFLFHILSCKINLAAFVVCSTSQLSKVKHVFAALPSLPSKLPITRPHGSAQFFCNSFHFPYVPTSSPFASACAILQIWVTTRCFLRHRIFMLRYFTTHYQ